MENTLWKELKSVLEQEGAALAGCGDLAGIMSRQEHTPPYPVGVAVAVPVPEKIVRQIQDGPTLEYYETYHSLNRKLNEIVLAGEDFLKNHPEFTPVPVRIPEGMSRCIEEPEHQLTMTPFSCGTDGFFVAVFEKQQA